MLKKQITYTDYLGREQTDTFYFNLTQAEAIELEVSTRTKDGFSGLLQKIIDTEDRTEMIAIFKKIIMMSYGEIDADGKRFVKSPELSTAFTQTEAYSVLYMGFLTDAGEAAEFVNGILPDTSNLQSKIAGQPQDHLPKQSANKPVTTETVPAGALEVAEAPQPIDPQAHGLTDPDFIAWQESRRAQAAE
jgi:hypothetical protein